MSSLLFSALFFALLFFTGDSSCQLWQPRPGITLLQESIFYWIFGIDAPSRIYLRNHLREKKYTTILDVGARNGIEYLGLKKDGININYCGIEIVDFLVKEAQEKGIPIMQGSIESLPMENKSFDIVYVRHLFDHLTNFEIALAECMRVARYEVMIIFFLPIRPHYFDRLTEVLYQGGIVFHHFYGKLTLEDAAKKTNTHCSFKWVNFSKLETVLHIYLES